MKKILLIITFLISNLAYSGATSSVVGSAATQMATGAAVGAGASYVANQVAPKLAENLGNALNSPQGAMVVGTIGGLNSYTLFQAASEQVDDSEKNIKKIETLMQAFTDSWVDYCPNGRNDLKVPTCYCYLESGKKNTNRTNSETCKALWATNDATNTATASNYTSTDSNSANVSGCLTTSGAFDEGCKCKRVVDSSGNNACQKVSAISTTGSLSSAIVSSSGASKIIDAANLLAAGKVSISDLSNRSMAIARSKQNMVKDKIVNQNEAKLLKAGVPSLSNLNMAKAQSAIFPKKELDSASKLFASNTMPAVQNAGLQNAIKAVEQKTGLELSGTGKGSSKKEENKNFNLNFNDSSSGNSANNAIDIGNEQKVYKIKGDINKDSGASIFEVISNRYLESGIRRLFPDDK